MKSQTRNPLAPNLPEYPASGSTGVESLQQGLVWNDPAAYEAVSGLQTIDPEIGQYLYNPQTRMFHPVYPVDHDPFNPQSDSADGESSDDDQTNETAS